MKNEASVDRSEDPAQPNKKKKKNRTDLILPLKREIFTLPLPVICLSFRILGSLVKSIVVFNLKKNRNHKSEFLGLIFDKRKCYFSIKSHGFLLYSCGENF